MPQPSYYVILTPKLSDNVTCHHEQRVDSGNGQQKPVLRYIPISKSSFVYFTLIKFDQ